MRAHLRGHDNVRPYACDFQPCGKTFTRSDELKRHKRIHNDDRNFPCPICRKKFLRSDHLSKHVLIHSKGSRSSAENTPEQKNPNKKPGPKQISQILAEQSEREKELYATAGNMVNADHLAQAIIYY